MAIDLLVFDFRKPERKFFEDFDTGCFNIHLMEESLNEATITTLPPEITEKTTAISVFISSNLTEKVLKRFKNLRAIATRSTGINHIDLEYCKNNNIAVLNVQNYGATAVAQYTFAMILTLLRNVVSATLYMREYKRIDNVFIGRNIDALTLGVIGTGAIGGAVCKLAHAFGMKVLAYDILPKEELIHKYCTQYVSLEELIQNSDIITLHTPYTIENYNMLSKPQFEMMTKKPYIINTSRGELINLADLKNALIRKQISGVALDVLTCESLTFNCEEFCPVLDNANAECIDELKIVKEIINWDNVIITPHIAYETQDAIDFILKTTMDNLRDFFTGGSKGRIV